MLPFELSNGICSLNPHVDRLTMSVVMDVNEDGRVYKSEIYEGVINSHARLTYKQVNNLFEKADESHLDKDLVQMLYLLKEAAVKIRKRRERYGALKLDSTELKFHLDEKGNPIEILRKTQGIGEKLIEDLMIITNVAVATRLVENNIPALFRVHDNPPSEKMAIFKEFLKNISLYKDFPSKVTSSSLAHWFSLIEDPKLHYVVSFFLLRSLAKAKYSPNNSGHFGLGEENYLHFTSPIRRYPDLLVHRSIRDFVLGNKKPTPTYQTYLENMGLSTSLQERRATTIEREVDDLEACKYMSKHVGETYKGIVTSILPRGVYLELENGVDCFLPIDRIEPSMKFNYSDKHMDLSYRGSKDPSKWKFIKLGDELEVVVYQVFMESKEISVVTTSYMNFLNTYNEYQEAEEKEEENLRRRKDNSRFKSKSSRRQTKGGKHQIYSKDSRRDKNTKTRKRNFRGGNKRR